MWGGGGGGGSENFFNYQSNNWMASKGGFQALGFNIFTPPPPPPCHINELSLKIRWYSQFSLRHAFSLRGWENFELGSERVLPYISHIGMCHPEGIIFKHFLSETGYRFCHFGLKWGVYSVCLVWDTIFGSNVLPQTLYHEEKKNIIWGVTKSFMP